MKKLLILLMTLTAFSCTSEKPQSLSAGKWRAVLQLAQEKLPFNFEVVGGQGSQTVYLLNGKERLPMDTMTFHNDSVMIPMHIFDAAIVAKVENDQLQGYWIKNNTGTDYKVPFTATFGESYRFSEKPAPAKVDVSGKWQVDFVSDGDTTEAVGVFEQKDNHLTGTFLTATGDYRFLEGNVEGNQLNLSCFDGTHAYLFKAQVEGQGSMSGDFWSGKAGYQHWRAQKNDKATLPDPDSFTFLKPGHEKLAFTFPDLQGNKISLDDPKYQGKVVIVQLLGSWCPNCMDETAFLAPFYKENKNKDVEIIGLAYEKTPDFDLARERVQKLIQRFDIQYDMLIAGTADKQVASQTLPMINRVMAFPTTIFIDKKGRVRKIHTGFSGPGTGEYYERFVEDFNRLLEKMLAEEK